MLVERGKYVSLHVDASRIDLQVSSILNLLACKNLSLFALSNQGFGDMPFYCNLLYET